MVTAACNGSHCKNSQLHKHRHLRESRRALLISDQHVASSSGHKLRRPTAKGAARARLPFLLRMVHGTRTWSAPMGPGRPPGLGPECGPLTSALTVGGPLIFHAAKCARASLEPLGQAEAALCASGGLVCRDIHPPPGGKAGHCRAPSPPMMSMCLHARL